MTPPPTKTQATVTNKHCDTPVTPKFTYHFLCPKGNPTLAPITQEEPELQPTAVATTENTPWRLDGKMYGKTNINLPLTGISHGTLNQFMDNMFLEELKRTAINATPLALKEVANGVIHPIAKETITKYKTQDIS